jgi:hypothetical protein
MPGKCRCRDALGFLAYGLPARTRAGPGLGQPLAKPAGNRLVRQPGCLALDFRLENRLQRRTEARQRPGAQMALEALAHRSAARQATRLEHRGFQVAALRGMGGHEMELVGMTLQGAHELHRIAASRWSSCASPSR